MKTLITAALTLVLFSCSTLDPYTGESKTSNASKGAITGALLGAVVGAATSSKSDRNKGILTGALAGAAVGGGTGMYMDNQEKKLRDSLVGSGVQVQREGDIIQLIMPGNITFASGQAMIRTDFYAVLDSVTKVLKEFKKTQIHVGGHTDNTGSATLNQMLSEQRANSVKMYLIDKRVDPVRVKATGYSFRYPIASNNTAQGRQINRRVELQLAPIE